MLLSSVSSSFGAKPKKTVDAESVLQQGRDAFFNYDFESAADLYDEYRAIQSKSKKPLAENFEYWERELEVASNAFDRVQKLIVVDSISVPSSSFYNHFHLARSAGQIGGINELSSNSPIKTEEIGFSDETGDFLIFPEENEDGELRMKTLYRLLDGSWETIETLEGDFELSGDYLYPFMSGDGQTLYFANDGEESMGGLDIFVAQRDPLTGEYRQPLNLGMPFNSPSDDFMMAVDEENGIGWWATDRDRDDGNVSIFVYLIEDIRRNYSPDTENLVDLAKLRHYKMTWEEGKEQEYETKMKVYKKR